MLIGIVLGSMLMGCQETPVYEEDILGKTYQELKNEEHTMTFSYYEGGACPVYKLGDYEGVYVVFPAVSDIAQPDDAENGIQEDFPVKILIQSSDIEIQPGLQVGMTAEETKPLHILWSDVYMSSENSLYYTSFTYEDREITVAWSIPEEMFSDWVASLQDEDDYYAEFLQFIQPFQSEPVGTVVEITVKSRLT